VFVTTPTHVSGLFVVMVHTAGTFVLHWDQEVNRHAELPTLEGTPLGQLTAAKSQQQIN
jgi:hypothetical protein